MRNFLLLLIMIVFAGCASAPTVPPKESLPAGPADNMRRAALSMKDKKYSEAVSLYQKVIAEHPESPEAADALYEIALSYASSDNTKMNYEQAIREFEAFLRRYPEHQRSREAENWIYALTMNLELKKVVEQLNKNIEKLKRLDIRHEERRTTR